MAVKRQIVAGVASLAALYVGVSNAIGLGEMQLQSALNQPFSALIEVQGSQGIHADDIRVTLASSEAFAQAGVERSHFLTGLRFVPVTEGGRLQIRVQSERPVREPYLNFLVELRQPSGRILREYVVLLDPPMYNPTTGRTTAPATSASQRTAAADPVPRTRSAAAAPAPAALPDLTPASDAARYTTVAGDTLWGIASARRPGADAGIRDTMLAIRALNPQAFVDGDINRLRQNQELILPTAAQLGVAATVPSSDSVSAEVADSAASSASPSPREQQPEVSDSAAPETEGDPAAAVAAAGTEDRLRIEALPEAVSGDAQAMQQRLTALESRFNILLSELEDRDNQIAMLQAELEVMRTAREAEEDAAASGVIAGGQLDGPEQGGPSSPGGTDSPAAGSLSADPLSATETAATPPPAATEQRSWVAWLWIPLAVLIAFLVGLFAMRRRERDPVEEAIEPVPPMQEEPRVLIPRPVKPQEAPKAAVDPLDGVELYLTYGRFTEARGMLDKAISEDPQRLELRYKQLRVLGELEDRAAFDQLADETLELGGDATSIEQVRMRFPAMRQSAADKADQVEQVDRLEPLLDDDDLDFETRMQDESADEDTVDEGQMNLNDFSLDPDWDLIDALGPETKTRSASDKAAEPEELDDDFESSLDRLPEVEELDEHDRSDQQKDGTRR